jgi:hypothetical protein
MRSVLCLDRTDGQTDDGQMDDGQTDDGQTDMCCDQWRDGRMARLRDGWTDRRTEGSGVRGQRVCGQADRQTHAEGRPSALAVQPAALLWAACPALHVPSFVKSAPELCLSPCAVYLRGMLGWLGASARPPEASGSNVRPSDGLCAGSWQLGSATLSKAWARPSSARRWRPSICLAAGQSAAKVGGPGKHGLGSWSPK